MRTESDVLRIDSTDMQKVTNQFKLMGYIKETRFVTCFPTSLQFVHAFLRMLA